MESGGYSLAEIVKVPHIIAPGSAGRNPHHLPAGPQESPGDGARAARGPHPG